MASGNVKADDSGRIHERMKLGRSAGKIPVFVRLASDEREIPVFIRLTNSTVTRQKRVTACTLLMISEKMLSS